MIIYVDTSTALKLVITEAETTGLAAWMTDRSTAGDRFVAGMLLFTELHCVVNRRGGIDSTGINVLLRSLDLADVDRHDFTIAAAMPGRLRSADAIHLAVALRLQADVMVTYDHELAAAGNAAGLMIESPT